MKKQKQGTVRQKELGKLKVEVWLTRDQMESLCGIANHFGLPKATFARRVLNYAVKGGVLTCKPAASHNND